VTYVREERRTKRLPREQARGDALPTAGVEQLSGNAAERASERAAD
jgi:hypothetical protein